MKGGAEKCLLTRSLVLLRENRLESNLRLSLRSVYAKQTQIYPSFSNLHGLVIKRLRANLYLGHQGYDPIAFSAFMRLRVLSDAALGNAITGTTMLAGGPPSGCSPASRQRFSRAGSLQRTREPRVANSLMPNRFSAPSSQPLVVPLSRNSPPVGANQTGSQRDHNGPATLDPVAAAPTRGSRRSQIIYRVGFSCSLPGDGRASPCS